MRGRPTVSRRLVNSVFGIWPRRHNRSIAHNTFQGNNAFFQISDEVQEALGASRPLVALETAIYTHGFPYPENLELAQHLEIQVRAHGGVPATIAVVDGVARVGLSRAELITLISAASRGNAMKLSRRDLGYICGMGAIGKRLHGGTTVAATMILARRAGITVFATGGLGGVHQGGEQSLDISADLNECGRNQMAVVSSGCKGFLDIPRTLEYLETQGVCVATFADAEDEENGSVDFPAFWTRESGVRSPMVIRTEEEAAAILGLQSQKLGLYVPCVVGINDNREANGKYQVAQQSLRVRSAVLLANPIPRHAALPKAEIDMAIAQAREEARLSSVTGRDNTPFILKRIGELTEGRSRIANRALVESNVIRGTRVAVALANRSHQSPSATRSGPTTARKAGSSGNVEPVPAGTPGGPLPVGNPPTVLASTGRDVPTKAPQVHVAVAGSLAWDSSCDLAASASAESLSTVSSDQASTNPTESTPQPHTSNPAIIGQDVGGVGHNVAFAAHLLGASVRLCSVVADDLVGQQVLRSLGARGLATSDIQILSQQETGLKTAQYVAFNAADKNLVVAAADMRIMESLLVPRTYAEWQVKFFRTAPRWLVVDGNWHPTTMQRWIRMGQRVRAKILYEPVSAIKAPRLFEDAPRKRRRIFPNHQVDIATPNALELVAMSQVAQEFQRQSRVEDPDQLIDPNLAWLDSIRPDLEPLVRLTNEELVQQGVPQQSITLLPYIPTILTKLGPQGVLLTQLITMEDPRLYSEHVVARNPYALPGSVSGVYLRLFPPAEVIPEAEMVSVNGAGDTFVGTVVAGLAMSGREASAVESLIPTAQQASVLTLKSTHPVSPRLGILQQALLKEHSSS
ncbi:MAG: hypothetical protein M1823_001979 [Watsoniomyces obsoletus]|nr:MAG: hypothetical protein M1823_001979 [Watsoniomyces obsoletus]